MKHSTEKAQAYPLRKGGTLIVGKTGVSDLIAVEGSVLGGPNFLSREKDSVPALAAALFDAGTAKRSKVVIREGLAERGALLSFGARGDRMYFSGQCFPEDLEYLLTLIAECLGQAVFPEKEFKIEKKRALDGIAKAKTDTNTAVNIAYSRMVYDADHVNYSSTLAEEEASLKRVSRTDLLKFRSMLGRGGLVLVLTGDVDAEKAVRASEKAFAKLPKGTEVPVTKTANTKRAKTAEELVHIKDKANVEVLLGIMLPFTWLDSRYYPAYVLADMLGGGFAAHLMQTVRERDGLTYGVSAAIHGFADGSDGSLRVWATFSPLLYAKGIETIRREIDVFLKERITEEALAKKKDEIAGSYVVGLSTARGLARTLHQFAIQGRPVSYISEYPAVIESVSLADVRAVAELVHTDALALSAAGTFSPK